MRSWLDAGAGRPFHRHADCVSTAMERRKEKDPLHAPDEPTGEELPVEPEMDKGIDPNRVGRNPATDSESGALAP